MKAPFEKILIANRGEIACRVINSAREMGVRTVAVYSDADRQALHVELADEAVHIGPSPVSESYLVAERIIAAALETGAQAIHPGYGFLSENPEFVEAVEAAGLTFIGPSAAAIRAMGLKDAAKDLMQAAGVPVVPGYQGENQDPAFLAAEADRIGYPVLIKARAGGGGKGMRKVEDPAQFRDALESAWREGQSSFGDPHVLIEKFITSPRHIEVQVFGDAHGNVVHLFERDCSLQRRHQKVIEEAPAPGMTDTVRAAMTEAAVTAAKAISYAGAGTIEFIVDGSGPLRPDGFWFMEMNTRLQVEHPVTEAITGVDLVAWQLRIAAGEPLPVSQDALTISGHAFEARLYAEDPSNGFLPATGKLEHLSFSGSSRNDTGVRSGDTISPFYDPMIAKVITSGDTREIALARLVAALRDTHVAGTTTNTEFLATLALNTDFQHGPFDTGLIERELEGLTMPTPVSEEHLAFAALTGLGIRPDTPRLGWRLWGEARHTVALACGPDRFERHLILYPDGAITLTGGARDVTLRDVMIDKGHMRATTGLHNAQIEARAVHAPRPDGLLISVQSGGVVHDFSLFDARLGSATVADEGHVVVAPMTGMIVSLGIAVGDTVEPGMKLGVMEAMKMETSLIAPRAGRIATVLCAAGQTVEGGAVLVTLEEEAAA
ncbi:acetyl/propionyl/methylcrotonyl-CoA carboxylase subunit alpha [Celeribacter neptunius]|uniref:3-methylcrotonyl-CoA carboxylase alpha subunit n=1 Tax=Celeribacter neptunius TaxID=588602 RepID=A0A1I3RAF5_9RHOB|nr:acetyl/propionyl/methylcrotonyl-CoA carboxylase subunit alpha [Celeribacter neptunius]SFJ42772.1 3-methylcrotonyl-CoA carboxylase alpha subunit [Celeribacter neptunius]